MSMPNDVDIVLGFLTAMRLGLTWVGISRAYTGRERQTLLADCGARMYEPQPLDEPVEFPDIDPVAPAVIAYTSGTTGVPKGATHSQRNLVVPGLMARERDDGHGTHGIYLPFTSVNLMCLGPINSLVNATTCVAIGSSQALDVANAIRDHAIMRLSASAATVIDFVNDDRITPSHFTSLERLGVGGSATPEWLFAAYETKFGRPFGTGYGLTEGPTTVTRTEIGAPRNPGSAGGPLEHLVIEIRDANTNLLATGDVGEVCLRPATHGLYADIYTPMLGYWQRPDATAQALRNGRLHTGDIGWLDAQGELHIEDRRVDLIVRGGTNIYPAEIERLLNDDPRILASAVIAKADERLGHVPVAFIQAADGADIDASAVLALCTENLAKFKVPVEVRFVDEFPRNSMGKILRTELRSRLEGQPQHNEE